VGGALPVYFTPFFLLQPALGAEVLALAIPSVFLAFIGCLPRPAPALLPGAAAQRLEEVEDLFLFK
jgi:hypothetical protein